MPFSSTDLSNLFRQLGQIASNPTHNLHTTAELTAMEYLAFLEKKMQDPNIRPSFFKYSLLKFSDLLDPQTIQSIYQDLNGDQSQHLAIIQEEDIERLRTDYRNNTLRQTQNIPTNIQIGLMPSEIMAIRSKTENTVNGARSIEIETVLQNLVSQNLTLVISALTSIFMQPKLYFTLMLERKAFDQIGTLIKNNNGSVGPTFINKKFVSHLIRLICNHDFTTAIKVELLKILFYVYAFTASHSSEIKDVFHQENNITLLAEYFVQCDDEKQICFLLELILRFSSSEQALYIFMRKQVLRKMHDLVISGSLDNDLTLFIIYIASIISFEYEANSELDLFNNASFYLHVLQIWINLYHSDPALLSILEASLYNFLHSYPQIFAHNDRITAFAIDNLQTLQSGKTILLTILAVSLESISRPNMPKTKSFCVILNRADTIFPLIKPWIELNDVKIRKLIFTIILRMLQTDTDNVPHFFQAELNNDIYDFLYVRDYDLLSSAVLIMYTLIQVEEGKRSLIQRNFMYANKLLNLLNNNALVQGNIQYYALEIVQKVKLFVAEVHEKKLEKANAEKLNNNIGYSTKLYTEILNGSDWNSNDLNCKALQGRAYCFQETTYFYLSAPASQEKRVYYQQQAQVFYTKTLHDYEQAIRLSPTNSAIIKELEEFKQNYMKTQTEEVNEAYYQYQTG